VCVAECCSALQSVAVRCRVLQSVAACCSMLQCVAVATFIEQRRTLILRHRRLVLVCVAERCSVLQRVAECCNVLQCVAVRCSALQSSPSLSNVAPSSCDTDASYLCASGMRDWYPFSKVTLQHTAIHCNTLQQLNILQRTQRVCLWHA